MVVKYSQTHITSTTSTTSTTFGGYRGREQNLIYINNDTIPCRGYQVFRRLKKELKLTSTHFYSTSTLPFNHLVVKYCKTHITSTTSTTSTTFGGSGGGG